MPCTFDDRYFEEVAAADRVILVAEPKPASLHSLGLVYNALAEDDHREPPLIVLNRFNPKTDAAVLAKLRETFADAQIQLIANDHEGVSSALQQGRPLYVQSPRSMVLADLKVLIAELFPGTSAADNSRFIPSRPRRGVRSTPRPALIFRLGWKSGLRRLSWTRGPTNGLDHPFPSAIRR